MANKNLFTCVLCGKEFQGYGNNPQPLKDDGRCCDLCDSTYVIPARLLNVALAHELENARKEKYAFILKTNGQIEKITKYGDDGSLDLETLQNGVGGYIEMYPMYAVNERTPVFKNCEIVCNEEGLINKLPVNVGFYTLTGLYVCGDIVIALKGMIK